MVYQIKRKNRVYETLELCNADGSPAMTLDVDIDVDAMGGRIAEAQSLVLMAQEVINKDPKSGKAQEAFGSSVIALFTAIFGKENAQSILAFYENRYAEMLLDVLPFISEAVMPAIRKVSAARKAQLIAAADAMRDWRT